jgi:hypothetical protein
MDIGSFFLILALLLLVALFVSRPFFEPQRAPSAISDAQDHELSGLLAERDRVLNSLQELDFDHALGKIPEEDYPAQRAHQLQYGAEILRKIDELQGESLTAPAGQSQESPEARIEAVIAARRADVAVRPGIAARPAVNGGKVIPAAVASPDEDLEVMLANRRRSRQGDSAGFCSKCGSAIQKSDQYCPKCGKKIV